MMGRRFSVTGEAFEALKIARSTGISFSLTLIDKTLRPSALITAPSPVSLFTSVSS
jgi:hypothetical protein